MPCIICLERKVFYSIFDSCIVCFEAICDKCTLIIDRSILNNYYINSRSLGACSFKCVKNAILEDIPDCDDSLFFKSMIENQHNIHISTILPTHLDTYIINDLTNVVIDYLVE